MQQPPTLDAVFALSSTFVDDYAKVSPIQATLTGIPGDHDGWDDYSPEGVAQLRSFLDSYRTKLAALPSTKERWALVARRVMQEFLDERIAYIDHGDNLSDLNNIESPFQHIRQVFDLMDTSNPKGFELVARRLETIDAPSPNRLVSTPPTRLRSMHCAMRSPSLVSAMPLSQRGSGSRSTMLAMHSEPSEKTWKRLIYPLQ